MYTRKRGKGFKHIDFMIIDILSVLLALFIAYIIRFGLTTSKDIQLYKTLYLIIPTVLLCVGFFSECYKGILRRGFYQEFKAVFREIGITYLLVVFYLYAAHVSSDYSRTVIILSGALCFIIMYIARCTWKIFIRKSGKNDKKKKLAQVMVVCNKDNLKDTLDRLAENEYIAYDIVSICIMDEKEFVPPKEWFGESKVIDIVHYGNEVLEYARTHVLDEVFINTIGKEDRVFEVSNTLVDMGIVIHINLDKISDSYPNKTVESFGSYTVMTSSINIATRRQLVIKRLMDIVGGAVGLLLAGIIFVIFAPIIFIQSPGPIFFKQERVGKNGRIFKIYKFRSMYLDAEERKKELMEHNEMSGFMFKMKNDPRIIPIGRFMRKTSLDEFPQFINVLMGDMSLVGTRPPTVDEYKKYELHHKKRLATKPGITGMWQVSGRSNVNDFEEVVRLDSEYISKWSIGLDCKILWKTLACLINEDGAV